MYGLYAQTVPTWGYSFVTWGMAWYMHTWDWGYIYVGFESR